MFFYFQAWIFTAAADPFPPFLRTGGNSAAGHSRGGPSSPFLRTGGNSAAGHSRGGFPYNYPGTLFPGPPDIGIEQPVEAEPLEVIFPGLF